MTTTIAVTTPTGTVGRPLVGHLLGAGITPRLLVRDAGRLEDAVRERCDVVEVDQTDADGLLAATRGVDALYWVSPPTGADDPVAEHERLGGHLVRAVAENGIGHTVLQSSVGAEKREGAGEISGLGRVEAMLDDLVSGSAGGSAGADHAVTHLRCGFFFTNLLLDPSWRETGVFTISLPPDRPMPWVAPTDIAAVAALRLLRTDGVGRVVQAVHGPRDLSWADAAAVVGAAAGVEVRAEQVPDDQMRAGLAGVGMSEAQVEAILGMSIGLRDGFTPEQPRDVTTTTPTTLEAWATPTLSPSTRGAHPPNRQ